MGVLVRWHLLLVEVATTRDLDDPTTVGLVIDRLPDLEALELLAVLTEADARATAPQAWSGWRAGLVAELTAKVRARMQGEQVPEPDLTDPPPVPVSAAVRADPALFDVRVEPVEDGTVITAVSGDRVGLLAAVAGALSVQRLSIRSARAWAQHELGVSVWQVAETDLDPVIVRERFEAVRTGRLDPAARVRPPTAGGLAASVQVRHEASRRATVVEVRAADRSGVVFAVCRAMTGLGVSVRSAHLATFGPQAVDVFYCCESGAGALSDERAATAAHAIRRALDDPATLVT